MVDARDGTQRQLVRGCGIALLLPLLLSSLTACSFFDPYIYADRRDPTYEVADPFPELRNAAANAEILRQKALSYRSEHVIARSLLGYGVFGAAAAGGAVAVYGGPRDLVLGLGLGAGGAYTFGELFVGTDKIAIYSATSRALNCVVGAADAVSATGKSLTSLTAGPKDKNGTGGSYWQQDRELEELLGILADEPADTRKEANQARAEYAAAVANFGTFKSLDRSFATTIDQAATMILEALEHRISAIQPNLDAVARAAERIGGLGVAYAKRVSLEPQVAASAVSPTEDEALAQLPIATAQVKQAAAETNEHITAATNRISQVGTTCVLDLPEAAKLSVSPTEVTLGEGQTVTLVASGGKLPLTTVWKDKAPSSDHIEVALSSGREIFLFGKTDLPVATYTLLVRDSLAAPVEIEIEITTASAKLTAEPDEVTVKAGTTASVAVSGGKADYGADWFPKEGEKKPQIDIKVDGGAITLTAPGEIPASGEHNLLITDSASPPGIALVIVKTE